VMSGLMLTATFTLSFCWCAAGASEVSIGTLTTSCSNLSDQKQKTRQNRPQKCEKIHLKPADLAGLTTLCDMQRRAAPGLGGSRMRRA
jgi:hypothetical protein